jgi:hypothetical protein
MLPAGMITGMPGSSQKYPILSLVFSSYVLLAGKRAGAATTPRPSFWSALSLGLI